MRFCSDKDGMFIEILLKSFLFIIGTAVPSPPRIRKVS